MQEAHEAGAGGMRDVQYPDTSRMALPVDDVPPGSDWFITQGPLARVARHRAATRHRR